MWQTLSEPCSACVELVWEAYRAGSLPIGAIVAEAEGRVLAAGRNRIHERSGPPSAVFGRKLAHAELNALLSVEGEEDPRACVLFLRLRPKVLSPFLKLYEGVMPAATRAARDAHISGLLQTMSAHGASAHEMVQALDERIPFFT